VGGALIGVAVQRHDQAISTPTEQRAQELDGSSRAMLTAGEVLTAVGTVALLAGITWGIVKTQQARRR